MHGCREVHYRCDLFSTRRVHLVHCALLSPSYIPGKKPDKMRASAAVWCVFGRGCPLVSMPPHIRTRAHPVISVRWDDITISRGSKRETHECICMLYAGKFSSVPSINPHHQMGRTVFFLGANGPVGWRAPARLAKIAILVLPVGPYLTVITVVAAS